MVHDVHGHGEDDGGVVLGGDAVQRLQVAELRGNNQGIGAISLLLKG